MDNKDFLRLIVDEIHTVVMATVDDEGHPVTCVIDMMMQENEKLYFITAKGKKIYDRLKKDEHISISGIKGENTMSSISATIVGKAREIGAEKLDDIFKKNTYMQDIYPTEQSKKALTVFEIYEGSGEFFDLRQKPIFRKSFSFNTGTKEVGYTITDKCIACGKCAQVCPTDCIVKEKPYMIVQENCLRCGNCYENCLVGAVNKL